MFNLKPGASKIAIKKAYTNLVTKQKKSSKVQELKEAYELLLSKAKPLFGNLTEKTEI